MAGVKNYVCNCGLNNITIMEIISEIIAKVN